MEDKNSQISKFQHKPYPPLVRPTVQQEAAVPTLVKRKKDYRAVVEANRANRSRRFRIDVGGGASYLCGYAHLIETIRQGEELITLVTSTRLFTLSGSNLETVERLLMEEKVREICVFEEAVYETPSDAKATYISAIEMTEV